MVESILASITVLLLVATLLPLWRNPVWWVRGWDFPRLQLAFALALVLMLQLLLLKPSLLRLSLLLISAGCLLYQLWWIVPYTPLFRKEVKPAPQKTRENTIRIITANVLMSNKNAPALLEIVDKEKPDILVTMESDNWWEKQLAVLEKSYPHTLKCPLKNRYGMHLYSRLPMRDAHISYLVEKDVPSMHMQLQLPGGVFVQAHFLHPAPPSPTENDESAERDAELLMVGKKIAKKDEPVFVAGDLNDVAWSRTTRLFRKISGLLDPRVGRGMFNTFHSGYPFIRWPLDHLFHSSHFTLKSIERLPAFGSDHFPILAELVLTKQQKREQEGLEADREDKEIVEEKIEAKGVSHTMVP